MFCILWFGENYLWVLEVQMGMCWLHWLEDTCTWVQVWPSHAAQGLAHHLSFCSQIFWAIGACFEVLLALIVMPTLGWRWLLALSAVPLLIFSICCFVCISSIHPHRCIHKINGQEWVVVYKRNRPWRKCDGTVGWEVLTLILVSLTFAKD